MVANKHHPKSPKPCKGDTIGNKEAKQLIEEIEQIVVVKRDIEFLKKLQVFLFETSFSMMLFRSFSQSSGEDVAIDAGSL